MATIRRKYYCVCGASQSVTFRGSVDAASEAWDVLIGQFLESHTGEGHYETDARTCSRNRAKADRSA